MKSTFGAFAILLFFSVAQAQTSTILERTKLALKAGNAKSLSAMFAPKVQIGFDGEADVISAAEAESKVDKFFKTQLPTQLEGLFQGLSKDGKQYFIGKLSTKTGSYRVSVYWTETPTTAIQSVDFSKE